MFNGNTPKKRAKIAKRVENLVAEEDVKLEKHIKREENINYILVKIYYTNLYIYFLYQFNI